MISRSHQCFTCRAPDVIDNPEKILGENYQSLLNFWIYLDTLDKKQWLVVSNRFDDLDRRKLSIATASYHDIDTVNNLELDHFWSDVFDNILNRYQIRLSVRGAAFEIYNAQMFLNKKIKFTFLPLFDNL
jgi:hypothetical protein